tara:strand:+ start:1125 stop:1334 length:210 start_codon:yes stop_codon:yes gene_type:complete
MVKYNPREGEMEIDDTTEDEINKLKWALDVLFTMLQSGNNLSDIQRTANQLASQVQYPFRLHVTKEEEE